VENGGKESGKWGCFVKKKWKMGGVFCKKSGKWGKSGPNFLNA